MRSDNSNRRGLLSLADVSSDEISRLGDAAQSYASRTEAFSGRLSGARIGQFFTVPSTRTRTSFWSAATILGCDVLHFGPADLQITTGETWRDTASVLATYLDVVVARTNGPQADLVEFAATMPATINALSYEEHPTQSIADLCALRDQFGEIDGLRVAYLGAVNNTARSLALMICKLPFAGLDVYSPDGLGFTLDEIENLNAISGAKVRQRHDIPAAPDPVDAVYTTRWLSMGAAAPNENWLSRFAPFAVTADLMRRFSGARPAVFMHDLPAVRDQEASSDVIDGTSVPSLVWGQVRHKGSAAAAALLWAMGEL